MFTVPDGDHLTLLNVFNQYMQSMSTFPLSSRAVPYRVTDKYDKNWAWNHYLSARALQQAENVREQLKRNMERYELDLLSIADEKVSYITAQRNVGVFTSVARKCT